MNGWQFENPVVSRRDSIRVVPLALPQELTAITEGSGRQREPRFTFRRGPIVESAEVTAVFIGSEWRRRQGLSRQSNQLADFLDVIVKSALIDQLAEYNTKRRTIRYGRLLGRVTIDVRRFPPVVSNQWLRHLLLQQTASGDLQAPTPNRLYFLYLPPGVRVAQGGSSSCRNFCGFHDSIGGQVFYAVVPYPSCQGCKHNLSTLDALTVSSSHELAEAVTDPVPGRGWYDDVYGEIGDPCAWQTKTVAGNEVQREWSNQGNRCV
jgi:hypothetical protein